MKILFIGDIVGRPGRQLVREALPRLVDQHMVDLVVANILAAPLIELAPRIVRLLKPGARLVLSGLLLEQAGLVSAAYPELEFAAPAIEEDQQGASWVRLEGRRPGLAGSAVAGRH